MDLDDVERQASLLKFKHEGIINSGQEGRQSGAGGENFKAREYDERASPLWSVYIREAESHDRALIETWKDDMEGIIVFAGLYSASLTAFLVESYQNLKQDPQDTSVALLQQTVSLLAHISIQLNGTQVPPLSLPDLPRFRVQSSDVRINAYWFMSLVFSLTAVLFATIVQQWVRDYMHVFQRYNSSLKQSRVRQFLFEGAETWKMAVVVDAIPALIHISLFLFFIGLCDFLFHINLVVAVVTTSTISVSGALYFWTMIAPVVHTQSPYQSPLSGVFWYIFQTIRGRSYHDNIDKEKPSHPVSKDMSEGRVQLAMDQSNPRERCKRDARAICWVMDNLTEDSEFEPFVEAISGSLNSEWGKQVWKAVANVRDSAATGPFQTRSLSHSGSPPNPVVTLNGRIVRLMKTCTGPGLLTDVIARRRARACLDAAFSLGLTMDGKWAWLEELDVIASVLAFVGRPETWEDRPAEFDHDFQVRWICMTITVAQGLLRQAKVRDLAKAVVGAMAKAHRAFDDGEDDQDLDDIALAMKTAQWIDAHLKAAWPAAFALRRKLDDEPVRADMDGLIRDVLQSEPVLDLDRNYHGLGQAMDMDIDDSMRALSDAIDVSTRHVLRDFPGTTFYMPAVFREWYDTHTMPLCIPPFELFERLHDPVLELRNLQQTGWAGASNRPDRLAELCPPELHAFMVRGLARDGDPMDNFHRSAEPVSSQLWRIDDLSRGGVLFLLELLIAGIRSRKEAHHMSDVEAYKATFHAIVDGADWSALQWGVATQRGLIDLLRDITTRDGQTGAGFPLPDVAMEFFLLVAEVLKGADEKYVAEALSLLKLEQEGGPSEYCAAAKRAVRALEDSGPDVVLRRYVYLT